MINHIVVNVYDKVFIFKSDVSITNYWLKSLLTFNLFYITHALNEFINNALVVFIFLFCKI